MPLTTQKKFVSFILSDQTANKFLPKPFLYLPIATSDNSAHVRVSTRMIKIIYSSKINHSILPHLTLNSQKIPRREGIIIHHSNHGLKPMAIHGSILSGSHLNLKIIHALRTSFVPFVAATFLVRAFSAGTQRTP
jgi:hypothetical protein